jgi:hypothetical protein
MRTSIPTPSRVLLNQTGLSGKTKISYLDGCCRNGADPCGGIIYSRKLIFPMQLGPVRDPAADYPKYSCPYDGLSYSCVLNESNVSGLLYERPMQARVLPYLRPPACCSPYDSCCREFRFHSFSFHPHGGCNVNTKLD